jgi:predicted lactoylglutathione lyase
MKKKTKFEVLLEHFQEFHEKPRAPTTLKSEEEVTSLSGADKREVRDNREKSKYYKIYYSILFIYYLLENS